MYKKDEDNPWVKAESQFKEGDTVEVPILLIKNFGVFVGIVPGIDGFIHISELSTEFIQAPAKIFNVGDIVKAKILEMNKEKQRIKLSVKAAQEGSPAESAENSTDSTDPQDQKDENTPENEPAC
ncbi:MAG: S1 RNA-binding domain-containing protein [Oscillospiraceae bacterium]|nr:S1 RNA-binding domain-containing protein [Oscillospiraceae bacterium]